MRTEDGEEISPYGLLHGKMMAKAAQDPNFHAVLSAEVNRAPLALEAAGGPQPGHQQTLHRADLPVVYQATLADGSGAPTYQLLAGEGMAQDNRLLPAGWRVDGEDTELGSIGPVGTDGDPDFGPGGDHVALVLEGLGGNPARIRAELLYQPVSPRHVAELSTRATPEVAAFRVMWDAADRAPETLAQAVADLP